MGGRFGVRAGVGPVVAFALVTLASAPLADTATAVSAPAAVVVDASAVASDPATVVADPPTESEAAADGPDTAAAAAAQPQAVATPEVTLRTAVYEVEQLLDREGRVERRLLPALDLVAGDELRYVITVRNETGRRIEPGRIEVRVAVPVDTRLLPGSAGGAGTLVEYALGAGAFSPHLPMVVEVPAPATAASPETEAAAEPVGATGAEPAAGDAAAAGAAAPPPKSNAGATAGPVERPPGEPDGAVAPVASGEAPTAAVAVPSAAPADEPSADAEPVSIRWTYQQPLEPMTTAELFFHVRLE